MNLVDEPRGLAGEYRPRWGERTKDREWAGRGGGLERKGIGFDPFDTVQVLENVDVAVPAPRLGCDAPPETARIRMKVVEDSRAGFGPGQKDNPHMTCSRSVEAKGVASVGRGLRGQEIGRPKMFAGKEEAHVRTGVVEVGLGDSTLLRAKRQGAGGGNGKRPQPELPERFRRRGCGTASTERESE